MGVSQPDYQRIHELEYELGFREDPPAVPVTDMPGAVIRYDPQLWRPAYDESNPIEVWQQNLREMLGS